MLFLALSDSDNWDLNRNVRTALKRTFGRVTNYFYRDRLAEIGFWAMQQELIAVARRAEPDFVLWPVSSYEVHESTLVALKAMKMPVVAWFFDDPIRFESMSVWAAPYVDAAMTADPASVGLYSSLQLPAIACPMACNPALYEQETREPVHDVSFVGSGIGDRAEWLSAFRDSGVNVQCFGRGWGELLPWTEVARVFQSSRVNLNFAGGYDLSATKQLKARVFEVTMAGGFLLTEYSEGLEDYFLPDVEIGVFSCRDEAIEKAGFYLAHEDGRLAIAARGHARALRDHTWDRRLGDVARRLESLTIAPDRGREILLASGSTLLMGRCAYHADRSTNALLGGSRDEARDAAMLALSYDHANRRALGLLFAAFLPRPLGECAFSLQARLFKLYSATRGRMRIRVRATALGSWLAASHKGGTRR